MGLPAMPPAISARRLRAAVFADFSAVLLPSLAPVSAEAVTLNPGDVIVEATGLIRVDPITGTQTVISQGGDGGIAIDGAGNVIFAAKDSGRLFRVDPLSGTEVVISSGLATPFGVAIDNTRGKSWSPA